jgi:hypothetical protein
MQVFFSALSLLGALFLFGCGESTVTMDDSGVPCSCASSEVCLVGRCYARCSETRPCGPREACSSEGICVSTSNFDAGPVDSGAIDAGQVNSCGDMTCGPAAPYCRAGHCLACESGADCVGMAPNTICDRARGICVPPQSGVCAPCNVDADCTVADPRLRCVTRDAPAPIERICLFPCGSEPCQRGGECDSTISFCVPHFNGSCTTIWAVLQSRSCRNDEGAPNDAACAPVGAMPGAGLSPGTCFDSSGGSNYQCHVPCQTTDHCFAGTCNTSMFCDGA